MGTFRNEVEGTQGDHEEVEIWLSIHSMLVYLAQFCGVSVPSVSHFKLLVHCHTASGRDAYKEACTMDSEKVKELSPAHLGLDS